MTQLIICSTAIRKDSESRFNLNDLHKASGGDKNKQPSNWLRLEQTQELISEIEQSSDMRFGKNQALKVIKGGINSGTFAAKELIYAYAMWISAKFHLNVIRAYDSLVTGQISGTKVITVEKVTEEQVSTIIRAMYPKKEDMHDNIPWNTFYKTFGIKRTSDLPASRFAEALDFISDLPCPHTMAMLNKRDYITEAQHQAIISAMTAKDAYAKGYWQDFYKYFYIVMTDDLLEKQFETAMIWIEQLPDPVPPLSREELKALRLEVEKQKFLKRDLEYALLINKELAHRMGYAHNPQNKSAIFIENPIWESEEVRKGMRAS